MRLPYDTKFVGRAKQFTPKILLEDNFLRMHAQIVKAPKNNYVPILLGSIVIIEYSCGAWLK